MALLALLALPLLVHAEESRGPVPSDSRGDARLDGPAPRIMSAAVARSAERTPRIRGARRDPSWERNRPRTVIGLRLR